MSKHHSTRVTVVAGALVLLSAVGVAAAHAAPSGSDKTSTATTPAADRSHPQVDEEHGIVVEASGSAGGLTASVTVYENSLHGNSVQVVLGEDRIGYDEGGTAYLVDGHLRATVSIDGEDAVVSGTLASAGRPENYVQPVQDAGAQIVTRGTHTALVGDLTLTYDGTVIALDLDTAFGYALETLRVPLYGG